MSQALSVRDHGATGDRSPLPAVERDRLLLLDHLDAPQDVELELDLSGVPHATVLPRAALRRTQLRWLVPIVNRASTARQPGGVTVSPDPIASGDRDSKEIPE